MLTINNLTYRIQGRELFEGASVALPTGSKTGFVGKNGTGKTTLFHLIQGHLGVDGGSIDLVKKARIGAVAQEAPASEVSVLDVVLAADTERAALLEEAETVTDPHRISEVYTRLADIDAHTAEARASAILKGLGFETDRQNSPTHELSGGWRMRVSLAGVLFSQPDLLLLDEPTNYLDLEGTLWLEKYLATYPYTVFMISHDRDLLNKAVSSIIHLEHKKLTFYKGNYDTFEATRRMQMELNNKSREKTLDQIAHMQKFVDRFKAKASKAKQAQARVKMIEKLKPPAAMFDEFSSPFTFQQPKIEQASPMITLEGVSAGTANVISMPSTLSCRCAKAAPALLIRAAIRGWRSRIDCTALRICACEERSAGSSSTAGLPDRRMISAWAARAFGPSRQIITSRRPVSASRWAAALPMPLDAPVMTMGASSTMPYAPPEGGPRALRYGRGCGGGGTTS